MFSFLQKHVDRIRFGRAEQHRPQEDYADFSELFNLSKNPARNNFCASSPHPTIDYWYYKNSIKPGDVHQINAWLGRKGMSRVSTFDMGEWAVLLHTTQGQLIRISAEHSNDSEPERHKHPAILQPITSCRFGKLYLEVINKVKTHDVEAYHTRHLLYELAKVGLYFDDIHGHHGTFQNIGLLEDGTPVVIDSGAVQPFKPSEVDIQKRILSNPPPPLPDGCVWDGKWCNEKGVPKQEVFFSGITTGEIQGVSNSARKKMLGEGTGLTKGHESSLVRAVNKGLYDNEVAAITARAIERFKQRLERNTKTKPSDFSGLLRQELDAYDSKPQKRTR